MRDEMLRLTPGHLPFEPIEIGLRNRYGCVGIAERQGITAGITRNISDLHQIDDIGTVASHYFGMGDMIRNLFKCTAQKLLFS